MNKRDMANAIDEPLTVRDALAQAFRAGESYAIGSHKDFVQTHEPLEHVVNYLEYRLYGGREPKADLAYGATCRDDNDNYPGGPNAYPTGYDECGVS